MFDIYFHKTPLSYSSVISDILVRNNLGTIASLGYKNLDTQKKIPAPFIIYEDTLECINLVREFENQKVLIYLLDFTVLSNQRPSNCILDLVSDGSIVLIPWAHRVHELSSRYSSLKIAHLALPVEELKNESDDRKGIVIGFVGSLESRIKETYEEVSAYMKEEKVEILNLNSNESLLSMTLEEEGIDSKFAIYPNGTGEIISIISNAKLFLLAHNSSVRDMHWSYLYSLASLTPTILGLRSDYESIPTVINRYYLGLDRMDIQLSLDGVMNDVDNTTNDSLGYIKAVHAVETFLYEVSRYQL